MTFREALLKLPHYRILKRLDFLGLELPASILHLELLLKVQPRREIPTKSDILQKLYILGHLDPRMYP